MAQHTFFIPTGRHYWEPSADDDSATRARWIAIEAGRAKALAERLFPGVDFRLVDDLPPSQTYDYGSLNQQIRAVLESRTTLRFASYQRRDA
jgi:hypothetical protein